MRELTNAPEEGALQDAILLSVFLSDFVGSFVIAITHTNAVVLVDNFPCSSGRQRGRCTTVRASRAGCQSGSDDGALGARSDV